MGDLCLEEPRLRREIGRFCNGGQELSVLAYWSELASSRVPSRKWVIMNKGTQSKILFFLTSYRSFREPGMTSMGQPINCPSWSLRSQESLFTWFFGARFHCFILIPVVSFIIVLVMHCFTSYFTDVLYHLCSVFCVHISKNSVGGQRNQHNKSMHIRTTWIIEAKKSTHMNWR